MSDVIGSGTTPVRGDTERMLLNKEVVILGRVPLKGDTRRRLLCRIDNVLPIKADSLRTLLKKEALL
jgi:hypothetical protein